MRGILALLGVALAVCAAQAGAAEKLRASCRAVDGDSLQCGRERIRLFDVYAVELREPGGREAKAKLQRLVRAGELTLVRHGTDRYGRTLADLYVNGRKVTQGDIGPRAGNGIRSGYASRPK